jgi:hypothetical protein
MSLHDMDTFATAFVEAALWADTPEDYQGNGLAIGLSSESLKAMRAFAIKFYIANCGDIQAYPKGITQAGHDLWFTLCGHGVGYWENRDDCSQRLDDAVKALSRSEGLYEGDDGLLHWDGVYVYA